MKKWIVAAVLVVSSQAFAQGAGPAGPAAPGAAQPAPAAAAVGHFMPQLPKANPLLTKELIGAVKAHHDAWSALDPAKVAADWSFPATVVTTDGQGNPSVFHVDEAGLKSALAAAFAQVPKPAPGEPSAKINLKAQKLEWQSNTLCTVTVEADLIQGKGKNTYKMSWKTTEIWARDAAGWKVKGYVSSGWAELLKH